MSKFEDMVLEIRQDKAQRKYRDWKKKKKVAKL